MKLYSTPPPHTKKKKKKKTWTNDTSSLRVVNVTIKVVNDPSQLEYQKFNIVHLILFQTQTELELITILDYMLRLVSFSY